jgi:hypothetical protein
MIVGVAHFATIARMTATLNTKPVITTNLAMSGSLDLMLYLSAFLRKPYPSPK